MPLAAPTNLAVSRLYRVMGSGVVYQQDRTTQKSWLPGSFDVLGFVSWTNTEAGAHTVELTINGVKSYLPKGATEAADMVVARFAAPQTSSATPAISVKLISSTEESEAATLTPTIDGCALPIQATNFQQSEDGELLVLPEFDGCLGDQRVGSAISRAGEITMFLGPVKVRTFRPRFSDANFILPSDLIEGETYRAVWMVEVSGVLVRSLTDYYRKTVFAYDYTKWQTVSQELFFEAPEPTVDLAVVSEAVRFVRGVPVRHLLQATRAATWEVTAGMPEGFSLSVEPTGTYLVGVFSSTGNHSLTIQATSGGDTATGTLTIGVFASDIGTGQKTLITVNPGWINNGLAYDTGDEVRVALASTPAPATWRAEGLPPGVVMSPEGTITGRPTTEGRFMASIFAQAEGYDESDPAVLTFTIRKGTGTTDGGTSAKGRIPWVLGRWELMDLQVLARSRKVESTLAAEATSGSTAAALRAKIGDQLNMGVFFIDNNDAPFALGPEELRVKVRPADNLDEALVLAEVTAPDAAGGVEAPAFDTLTIEAGAASVVTITGATSGATRSGGGVGESDLIFSGRDSGRPWPFGFCGGEGEGEFAVGETVTITRAEGYTTLPIKGTFRVVTIDGSDNAADPWVVLERVDPSPYYLLATSTGNRQRERLLEWVGAAEKPNEPLACVGEVEWVKDGKTYSSQYFPIALELDVVRSG